MKMGRGLAWAVAVTVAIGCGGEAAPTETPAMAVEAVTVQPTQFTLRYSGPASLEGWRVADLASELTGRISLLAKEQGESVRAGEVIGRIDAGVQNARSLEASARIADAEVAVRNAEENFARVRTLRAEGVAAQQELENALAARDRSSEQLAAARASAGAAGGEIGKTVIRAPFDGIVTVKGRELGEIVGNNSLIYRIEDLTALKAIVQVPEREIAGIAVGSPADLALADGGRCTGVVTYVSPAADPLSRAVKVEVRIENPDRRLRSGLFADIGIVREIRAGALMAPRASVLKTGEERGIVYVVEGDTARKREVTLGVADDFLYEIVAGLKAGEAIATSGVSLLADGARVRRIGAEAPAASR